MLTAYPEPPGPMEMLIVGLACIGGLVLFQVARYALQPHYKQAVDMFIGAIVRWRNDEREWKKVGEEKYPDVQLPERYWHQWHRRGERKGRR